MKVNTTKIDITSTKKANEKMNCMKKGVSVEMTADGGNCRKIAIPRPRNVG